MSYMSDLRKVEAQGLNVYRLVVANEVDYFFSDFNFSEEQLDGICDFVYDWIADTEASAEEVSRELKDLLEEKEITIDQIIDWDDDVIEKLNWRF